MGMAKAMTAFDLRDMAAAPAIRSMPRRSAHAEIAKLCKAM